MTRRRASDAGRIAVAALAVGWLACLGATTAEGDPRPPRPRVEPVSEVSAPPDRVPAGFRTVVIDAGHGGEDRGARGARGLLEKELVLDVSRRLARRLRERELQVVLTRDGDRFVGLEERTSLANDVRGDLFLSIHANAARTSKARGFETFFASLEASDDSARELAELENSAFHSGASRPSARDPLVAILGDLIANEHLRDSQEFARLAQGRLDRMERKPTRGVKQAPFVVLLGVQMPAALVEVGFLTNEEEEAALRRSTRRESIAEALEAAVLEFARRYDARRGVSRAASPGGR